MTNRDMPQLLSGFVRKLESNQSRGGQSMLKVGVSGSARGTSALY